MNKSILLDFRNSICYLICWSSRKQACNIISYICRIRNSAKSHQQRCYWNYRLLNCALTDLFVQYYTTHTHEMMIYDWSFFLQCGLEHVVKSSSHCLVSDCKLNTIWMMQIWTDCIYPSGIRIANKEEQAVSI